jgi:hypothetical protein
MEMMNSVSFQFCKFKVLCQRIIDHKISYYGVGWAIIFQVHFFCFFFFLFGKPKHVPPYFSRTAESYSRLLVANP